MRLVSICVLMLWLAGPAWGQDARVPDALNDEAAGRQLPPTIADVVGLLQSYKPDTEKVQRLRQEVNAPVPERGDPVDLARAWHRKFYAASEMGDMQTAYEFALKAKSYAEKAPSASGVGEVGSLKRVLQDIVNVSADAVGPGASLDAADDYVRRYAAVDPGSTLTIRAIALTFGFIGLGDMERARESLASAQATANSLSSNPVIASGYASTYSTLIQWGLGRLHIEQGKPQEAVRTLMAAERASLRMIEDSDRNRAAGRFGMPRDRAERIRDMIRIYLATALIAQQSYNDAELLLRDVMKEVLSRQGRTNLMIGAALAAMSRVYAERGRLPEALAMAQWSDHISTEAGAPVASRARIPSRRGLGNLYAMLGRYSEAVAIYEELQKVSAENARYGSNVVVATPGMVMAYAGVGRTDRALASGDLLLSDTLRSYGVGHYATAEARGYRAIALQRAGRLDEARTEFVTALRILLEPDASVGGASASATRASSLRVILNGYLSTLVGPGASGKPEDVEEAFRVADVVRWQLVQKAVSGSAVRAAAGTPELGARIKRMQDNEDELQAVYKNLIAQRSAPPDKQLPAVIAAMERRITELTKEQANALADIRKQFPRYDALVNPRPADLPTARQALQPNEALLSIYVTDGGSYVWAVGAGAGGALLFHYSPRPRSWIAAQVKRLRDAVDLTAGVTPDRMRFDVEAAQALYQELLAPVQAAWSGKDTLLVAANDALGQIPFALLVTDAQPASAQAQGASLPLSSFRHTPWLARQVATAYVPSVSALVTLRSVPASREQRAPFVGFGDPDFGAHTAKTVAVARGTRNLKIKHAPQIDEATVSALAPDVAPSAAAAAAAPATAEVPELTPLPDTRAEIIAIATALTADPAKDAFFGPQANPQQVTQTDLKRRRIVAFATHGLVAGDLPGLDQPALALSPAAGKDIYSGLLKLEDVLRLSLDADLVVLSACNTAAADGSGSEAVSGLGRGFFYAGSRSVLATHWPVETVSARQLVTHLFQRYAQDGTLTRAKALQRAMLEVMDKEVARDAGGKAVMAYAHPAFWAPYALYGDPGR
jgi:CHAT domain-containing protein